MEDLERRFEELADLMDEFGLVEAKLSGPDWKLLLRKGNATAPSPPLAVPQAGPEPALAEPLQEPEPEVELEEDGEPILSPMTGVYYSSPSPKAPAFVREGQEVQEGDVLCLIEAMKVFNEIVAPRTGIITKVLAKDQDLVQTDQELMVLKSE